MSAPHNSFKASIGAGHCQIGLWLGLPDAYTAEINAAAGFDWLLLDGEHAPHSLQTLLAQLQAIGQSTHPVVRIPQDEPWMLKQVLDIGAQTVLVPMVESAEQARRVVRAVRYPPQGIRGVASGLVRAAAYGRHADYLTTANAQICVLVQVESRAGVDALDEIAAVDGVDGIFVGPSDLAADLGFLGKPQASEVQTVVEATIVKTVSRGKAAGILTTDVELADRYIDLGATFVAVGTDVGLLSHGAAKLAGRFRR